MLQEGFPNLTDCQPCVLGGEVRDKDELHPNLYKQLRPQTTISLRYTKVHKEDVPLCPIISTIGSPIYAIAKHLAKLISPLVGQTKSMVSFDVKSLFTNTPVLKGLQVIQTKLENDETLPELTEMRVNSIMMLLMKCMESSYFTYDGGFYQQTDGAAMGSPLSPILANLFMEWFEEEVIRTKQTKPTLWLRYVDLSSGKTEGMSWIDSWSTSTTYEHSLDVQWRLRKTEDSLFLTQR